MEFSLLQKQLDPHTLYNSLSAIKYNAFIRKDADTIDIVNNMTDYYRSVLNKGNDFINLRDELVAMEKYVAINEVSRDIKYTLETSMSKELYDCTIIHFLLLPFVENSIIHGFDGTEDECRIKIDCKKVADFIVIKISDNGFGMTKEQVSKLNNLENYDESYGIKNSYRRMKLIYGDDSQILYESELNKGTTVTLKFKYKF
jgi:two-component system sensor histidine kinase YesM